MDADNQEKTRKIRLPAALAGYLEKHTLFMPIITAFVSFIVVVIAALIIWFSTSLKASLEETVYETAKHETEIASDQLRITLKDFDAMSGPLGLISAIAPGKYHGKEYYAFESIKAYNSSSYKYDNLLFYYPNEKMMLSVLGTAELPIFFYDITEVDAFRDMLESIAFERLVSTASYGAPLNKARLLLIQPLLNKATAIFLLSDSTLADMLASGQGTQDSLRFIVSGNGTALWSSEAVSGEDLGLILSGLSSGLERRQIELGGKKYICSVAKLGNDASFIVLDAVSTRFHTVETSIIVLSLLCAILILLGISLLVFGTRRAAVPITTLVDDFRSVLPDNGTNTLNTMDILRNACAQYSALAHERSANRELFSDKQMHDAFILRLICGQYADASSRDNLCSWLNIDLPYPYYSACLLLFDDQPDEAKGGQLRHYLDNIRQENLRCYFCMTPDGQSAVGMINLASADPEQASMFGEKLLSDLMAISPVTIGLGCIYDRPDLIGRSYLEACAAMDQRLIRGTHSCIVYNEAQVSENENEAYPRELLDQYVTCLRQWDTAAIQRELNSIIQYIHDNNLSLQQVKCICFDLTSSFVNEFNTMGSLTASIHDMAAFDVFSIAEYTSVTDLAQKIVELSGTIENCIEMRRIRKHDSVVNGCQALIEENLSNPQFSLSVLAEHFGITQQTLRRRFKETTGQTLSSYLTARRIELAKTLLSETNLSMNEICVKCGYIDVSSFTKLFKSEVGISPGAYRETHSEIE